MNSTFPPPFSPFTGTTGTAAAATRTAGTGNHKDSVSPSIFVIIAIVAVAIVIILFIHRILRVLFRSTLSSSSYLLSVARTGTTTDTGTLPGLSEQEKTTLINSLPLFTLNSSSLSIIPKSRDCAICCEVFLLDAELRLLPACYHAFHKPCIDPWLKANPSCPICRSSITLPFPPLLECSPGSFRLELGNVSSRRSEPGNLIGPADAPSEHESRNDNQSTRAEIQPVEVPTRSLRSYSMDSYDYFIEEEIEISLPRVIDGEETEIEMSDHAPPSPPALPPPPPPKAWLQEFVERITNSATSSFNSNRFGSQRQSGRESQQSSQRWSQRWSERWSERWSQRFAFGEGGVAPAHDAWLYDLEASQSEESGRAIAVYRWFTGV